MDTAGVDLQQGLFKNYLQISKLFDIWHSKLLVVVLFMFKRGRKDPPDLKPDISNQRSDMDVCT